HVFKLPLVAVRNEDGCLIINATGMMSLSPHRVLLVASSAYVSQVMIEIEYPSAAPASNFAMPVLPVAPGEFTTGKETLRSSSMSLAAFRASWSAPPPGPQGTMNSIGRDGYFSCAEANHESETSSSAVAARKVHLIEGATCMGISSGSSVNVEALFSRA